MWYFQNSVMLSSRQEQVTPFIFISIKSFYGHFKILFLFTIGTLHLIPFIRNLFTSVLSKAVGIVRLQHKFQTKL